MGEKDYRSADKGYSGSYGIVNHASGTLTSLPSAGQVVRQGHVLYRVDTSPVVLLYGSTPAYRDLTEGESGPDVKSLNADLVALGDATSASLDPTSDYFGAATSFGRNVDKEYERNLERYRFLRWGSSAFNNFRVVPPGTGICHQVNLEYLAQTVWTNLVGDNAAERVAGAAGTEGVGKGDRP